MGQEKVGVGAAREQWLRGGLHEAPAGRGGRGRDHRDQQEKNGRQGTEAGHTYNMRERLWF